MNKFVWCDLSTFDLEEAKRFYSAVFGWSYSRSDDYCYALGSKAEPVAGLFVMPEFLQNIGMPSFWMPYIAVDDVEATVTKAEAHHGAKIEVRPSDWTDGGRIALIRDPAGAGFTVYQGPQLEGLFESGHGRPVWVSYHLSDMELSREFYQDLFGWRFVSDGPCQYTVFSQEAQIADVEILSEAEKGNKQYWMPTFHVRDSQAFEQTLVKSGGLLVARLAPNRIMAADPQGGSFMVSEVTWAD